MSVTRCLLRRAVILLLLLISTSSVYAASINIELKDRVLLPKKQIVMGDLAVITSHDDAVTQRISDIKMGHTPWPGNTLRVGKDIFYMRLSAEGVNLADVSFGGNTDAVTVDVESVTFTGQEIAERAKAYLYSRLPWDYENFSVELERLPSDVIVPMGQSEPIIKISDTDSIKDRGPVQLRVSVIVDGKVFTKFRVFFRVHIFEDVVLVKKQLRRLEVLSEDDLYIKRTETTKLGGLTFGSIEDLVGKRTIRPIRPYSVVTFDMVETPPAIRKGDVIKMLVKKGNFMVTAKGISNEDGKKGDVIRVKNYDSKKQLYGKVIDSETVAIAF